jgi:four helix bundle protein
MDNSRDYEKLPAWQKAMELAVHVHRVVRLWPDEERDVLVDDSLRTAVLVASNIEEGHESGSMSEMLDHADVARGKLGRLQSLLILAQQLGYYSLEEYEELAEEIAEVRVLIDGTAH